MKFEEMTFRKEEVRTIYEILSAALMYDEVRTLLDSKTIDAGFDIRFRINYTDYARRHGKRVEDLTSDDIDDADYEMWKEELK